MRQLAHHRTPPPFATMPVSARRNCRSTHGGVKRDERSPSRAITFVFLLMDGGQQRHDRSNHAFSPPGRTGAKNSRTPLSKSVPLRPPMAFRQSRFAPPWCGTLVIRHISGRWLQGTVSARTALQAAASRESALGRSCAPAINGRGRGERRERRRALTGEQGPAEPAVRSALRTRALGNPSIAKTRRTLRLRYGAGFPSVAVRMRVTRTHPSRSPR